MKRVAGRLGLAVAVVAASLTVASARGVHAVRYVMGTWCDLVLLDSRPDDHAAEAAFQEIARLERILSNWDETSEVSRLNAKAGQGPLTVSADLAAVVQEAEELCAKTDGAFDASVGSIVHAWGFDSESPMKPSSAVERDAASRVGCDRATLQPDAPSIALTSGTRLDLGGIGKGYAVDRALAVLRAHGVTRAKLDFGSSSLGFMGHVEGSWPVVIADPRDRDRPLLSFRIDGGSVSSSGQHERSFVLKGHRFGHIFDPRTGVPVESSLLLVTVIAPRASTADGLSTALFVLGADRGGSLVSNMPGVSAIFIEEQRGHVLSVRTVGPVTQLTRLSQ
jgi:FAD:protein FMN transferase